MNFAIQPMTASLLAQAAEIEAQCFSLPWTLAQLNAWLDAERYVFLAALTPEGRLAGYINAQYVLDEGYIGNVAVDSACRRQGVGGALVSALQRWAVEHGLSFLTLEVRAGNAAARNLYEKQGFQVSGLRRDYYSAPREDAILMTWETEKWS